MLATGLKKGGIYRHFSSKGELSVEALRFATDKMAARFTQALAGKTTARERLRAVLSVYARIPVDPPVPGGCPLLNAAVEVDDGNPELRAEVLRVLKGLMQLLRSIFRDGQKHGEFAQDLDVEAAASVLVGAATRLLETDSTDHVGELDAAMTKRRRHAVEERSQCRNRAQRVTINDFSRVRCALHPAVGKQDNFSTKLDYTCATRQASPARAYPVPEATAYPG